MEWINEFRDVHRFWYDMQSLRCLIGSFFDFALSNIINFLLLLPREFGMVLQICNYTFFFRIHPVLMKHESLVWIKIFL